MDTWYIKLFLFPDLVLDFFPFPFLLLFILNRSTYWEDLITIHKKLGLATQIGNVTVLAPINSHRNYELMVISDHVDESFIKVYTDLMRMFNNLQLYCRSLAMSWPMLEKGSPPSILFIHSRGLLNS